MIKEFVPYEMALELKELGFDEPCFGYYGENQELIWKSGYMPWVNSERNLIDNHFVTAPLYQQVFRWFRENHKLICFPEPTGSWRYSCSYRGEDKDGKHWVGHLTDKNGSILFFNSYEEAELECIKKLIKIVKK